MRCAHERRHADASTSMEEFTMATERDQVRSVQRAFEVLAVFGPDRPTLNLRQAAEATGFDRAVVRRYLLTLEQLGYLARMPGDSFRLRPKILTLAWNYLGSDPLAAASEQPLRALRDETGESCAVTVLSGATACFVGVANAETGLSIRLTLGNELPCYCTAMGRTVLSGLPSEQVAELVRQGPRPRHTNRTPTEVDWIIEQVATVAERGWDVADEELEIGVRSVAVRIPRPAHLAPAALSVSAPTARCSVADLRGRVRGLAQESAERIAADLG
ncbi:hypothetical protein CGZ96_00485 [Enemella evansiae]|nr:hypothetical protein CGZ96_00485 [Enemella evansiae]